MKNILKEIETPYIDSQTLINLLSGYRKPHESILRMIKNGELIRLKNGFYLIADKISQGRDTIIPYEQVANLLYGPSYVSLEWALSFYGMIPERVHVVTSMTLGRNKEYHTPMGDFFYYKLSQDRYTVGIMQKESSSSIGSFLMATPEKALADLVHRTCKGLDREQLVIELIESKRIDRNVLKELDKSLLSEIARLYNSKTVKYLNELAGIL